MSDTVGHACELQRAKMTCIIEMTMHRLQAVTSLVTRATFHAQRHLPFFFPIIVYPFHLGRVWLQTVKILKCHLFIFEVLNID